jgi:molybdate transport system substrate-binding protein
MLRRLRLLVCLSLLVLSLRTPAAAAQQTTLLVSAAASLTFAFQELGTLFEQATGTQVLWNFASSGQLAQQIERGAPVDVFASANTGFIDLLARQGLIIPDTRLAYAQGRLTLWSRADSPLRLTGLDDLTRPEVKRVAIANPTHAPYGVAAREALQAAGLWKQLSPKLVMGENVRQTLQYAATGNVDAAIIALSMSVQHAGRWVMVPDSLHRPILQAVAVIKGTQHEPQARQFVAFLSSPQGQAVMRRYGFTPPPGNARP